MPSQELGPRPGKPPPRKKAPRAPEPKPARPLEPAKPYPGHGKPSGVPTVGRTYQPKPGDITREWFVIDAEDLVLGRLASQIATILRGKHKPYYAPHIDTGDFVVVVNASKVALTGKKREQGRVYTHSGFPGGLKSLSYESVLRKRPERLLERAVQGMLPHSALGRQMLRKLKVYPGPTHPHQAQAPVPYEIRQVRQ
jgi:large subunit ribosomal protein L13